MRVEVRDWVATDVDDIVSYFLDADVDFLVGMGVDTARLPDRQAWSSALLAQTELRLEDRERHYQIWLLDGTAVGHSNASEIEFGRHANMHLHMWDPAVRGRGRGTEFVRRSIDRHFELFELAELYCEPYALNPAPNRTLPKLGFELLETVVFVPGPIAFEQSVNRWRMTRERWAGISSLSV